MWKGSKMYILRLTKTRLSCLFASVTAVSSTD